MNSKNSNKILMIVFALIFAVFVVPTVAFADEGNTTENESANVSVNTSINTTTNVTDNVSANITVNILPVADFTYSPLTPVVNESISFNSVSYDTNGSIVKEEWDINNDGLFTVSGHSLVRSFDLPGNHTVSLKVTDNSNTTATVSKVIVVANPVNNSTNVTNTTNTTIIASCSDTDGNNTFKKGRVFGINTSGSAYSLTDYCFVSDNVSKVREYYCSGVNYTSKDYICQYGCHDRACLPTPANNTNTSVIDDDDIEMFKTNYGMEVRLLQLEKRLISHIIMGKVIIAEINNSGLNVSTEVLQDKIDGLQDIKEEIDDELAKDPVNVSTEKFVEMKANAITLTFEFRKELYSLLTPAQINSIKKEIPKKMIKHEYELKMLDGKLKDRVEKYNKDKARQIMGKFGLSAEELEDRLERENTSSKELREKIKEEYKELSMEKKKQVLEDFKETKKKDLEAKNKLYGSRMGLDREEINAILNDSSLTWTEKEAKLRILAKEKINNDEDENESEYEDEPEDEDEDKRFRERENEREVKNKGRGKDR